MDSLGSLVESSANPLRLLSPDNFYDLQARAMLAGRLYLPNGSIGIEAFIHDGHQYTYFGLFPSLLRLRFCSSRTASMVDSPHHRSSSRGQ